MIEGWCELHAYRKPCACPGPRESGATITQTLTITDTAVTSARWDGDRLVWDHYRNGAYVGTTERF